MTSENVWNAVIIMAAISAIAVLLVICADISDKHRGNS